MDKTSDVVKKYFRTDLPPLQVGEKVEVTTKNFNQNEKNEDDGKSKRRLIRFKGTVIAQKNRGQISYTFSVLKESGRVAIRSIFFYHSPLIVSIEKFGKINQKFRQVKLNHLERELAKKKDNE